jgi:hypothetical protein
MKCPRVDLSAQDRVLRRAFSRGLATVRHLGDCFAGTHRMTPCPGGGFVQGPGTKISQRARASPSHVGTRRATPHLPRQPSFCLTNRGHAIRDASHQGSRQRRVSVWCPKGWAIVATIAKANAGVQDQRSGWRVSRAHLWNTRTSSRRGLPISGHLCLSALLCFALHGSAGLSSAASSGKPCVASAGILVDSVNCQEENRTEPSLALTCSMHFALTAFCLDGTLIFSPQQHQRPVHVCTAAH